MDVKTVRLPIYAIFALLGPLFSAPSFAEESRTWFIPEAHVERLPEFGQTAFGFGARVVHEEVSPDSRLRFSARLVSQHPVADANATKQFHGVAGEVGGSFFLFPRHLYFGLKLAEGSPLHFEGMSGRVGVALGNSRNSLGIYAGESLSKELLQDVLALTGLLGFEAALQPNDWIELRAALDAGVIGASHREANGLKFEIIRRALPLSSAQPTAPGSLIDGNLQIAFKLKDKIKLLVGGRVRRTEIPMNGVSEVSTLVGGNFGVGGAF